VDRERRGEGPRSRTEQRKREEESCLILDEEVDQVVQAALGHQDVVGIVDSRVMRFQRGHREHR
jgi:hypothetical protein